MAKIENQQQELKETIEEVEGDLEDLTDQIQEAVKTAQRVRYGLERALKQVEVLGTTTAPTPVPEPD